MQKTEISKPEVILSLILDQDPYPKYKHQQRTKQAAENKPNSLKLSKSLIKKSNQNCLTSFSTTRRRNWTFIKWKKNTKRAYKNCDIS